MATIKTYDVSITALMLEDCTQVCAENVNEAREVVQNLIKNGELFEGQITNPCVCEMDFTHVYNEDDEKEYGEDYVCP